MKVHECTYTKGLALGVLGATFALVACQPRVAGSLTQEKQSQVVTHPQGVDATDKNVAAVVGDHEKQFHVYGKEAFQAKLKTGTYLNLDQPSNRENLENKLKNLGHNLSSVLPKKEPIADPNSTLLVSIPLSLLNEKYVLGGVITKFSDPKNEDLAALKLTDLPAAHVKPVISKNPTNNHYLLVLLGCVTNCHEGSPQTPILSFPITAFQSDKADLVVDLAPIGKGLDLISMLDPDGQYTEHETESTQTTYVDYSFSTLIFDIESKMVPVVVNPFSLFFPPAQPTPSKKGEPVIFTTRWYLKLTSTFNSNFDVRKPVDGVGFFETHTGTSPKITRFSQTFYGRPAVHYYIKSVPLEYQPFFANALNEWNKKLFPILGVPLISYEFVSPGSSLDQRIVTGDVRFNVIEWDTKNKASYGGLGPSIANQHTGEIFSANILVQGPTIIQMYSKWFHAAEKAKTLLAQGFKHQADQLLVNTQREIQSEMKAYKKRPTLKLSLGEDLEFRIPAQEPHLQDPLFDHKEFEMIPEGLTFESYMKGYFQELVAHEVGHNLGLRHNFSGNLGARNSAQEGGVSLSVMEYMARPYRHLNRIGPYDIMAIAYGYTGRAPTDLTLFCTDEQVPSLMEPTLSAECSKNDATQDPFSYLVNRLNRVASLLVNLESPEAPIWEMKDLARQAGEALAGITFYSTSAQSTGHTWKQFFNKPNRPQSVKQVPQYVEEQLKAIYCNPALDQTVLLKTTPEAREKTKENLTQFRKTAALYLMQLKLDTGIVSCEKK